MRLSPRPGVMCMNTTSLPAGLNAPRMSEIVGDVMTAVGAGGVHPLAGGSTVIVSLNCCAAIALPASKSLELPSVITTSAALFVVPKLGRERLITPHGCERTSNHCGPTTVCDHSG